MTTPVTLELNPRMLTVVKAMRQRRAYLLSMGQNIQTLYPHDKIAAEVFENITVPVPMPILLMLLALGCEVLARTAPAEEKKEPADAA